MPGDASRAALKRGVLAAAAIAALWTLGAVGPQRADARPQPPDVDNPPGFQDVPASNPKRGFRSRSEMLIAQNPLDPNMLVAASKLYNRDRDSLKQYTFKVGSYISFDGGRSWDDLGQVRTCKLAKAPPSSWPRNRCYPRDLPGRAAAPVGTGGHATGDADAKHAKRPGHDVGERYLTSDPWVRFDDEGNAYLMLLDAPPFRGGAGGGMSMHVWRTPSAADVRRGRTWGAKIAIDSYKSRRAQRRLLDDKNTFAINNAGPDADAHVGPIVACWSKVDERADHARIVCKRSGDGGRSWPGRPVAISEPAQSASGVYVVADNRDPERFYAMWIRFEITKEGGFENTELLSSRSDDGGRSWSPAAIVRPISGLPPFLPGEDFRNISFPSLAAGPEMGELYAVYAEYLPAASADPDGKQADVMLIRSTDGGATWSAPVVVNGDGTNADQFQPSVAVTPAGQVDVSYFDRRNDPSNHFIDTYLSRSNDDGHTFTDVRVSHGMWDPGQRPPISTAGTFIGDYQGLVADDCRAIPLATDAHLATARSLDPDFDAGVPRSPFQQAISWRVSNQAQFGGPAEPAAGC